MKQLLDIFQPKSYILKLKIDALAHKFTGSVEISGQKVSSEPIRLNASRLKISSAAINGENVSVSEGNREEIILAEDLKTGSPAIISIDFSGEIKYGDLSGLYPSRYQINGEDCELLSTQFESTGARKVFPCIDEPSAKAEFSVELTLVNHEKTLGENIEILSNMPQISKEIGPDKITVKFAKTPRMSTYLLAFVAGNLQKTSRKTSRGVEVNVFATRAQDPETLSFAAEFATKSIDFYEEYFGVNYPLAKSDHVAIPDFSAGAMENWGLITYRESCLLTGKNDAASQKQYVATVVAHELAHQWFGNLVTMKWWDDLWLNESFANFMENFTVDHLHPEWNIWQNYESWDVLSALMRDSLPGVQSVREKINAPEEIDTLFDGAIVYAKGGRMLRMVHALVGDKAWRAGLKNYFAKYAYKNTSMNDLWREISSVCELDFDLVAMMNDLLTRPGYPVVMAEILDSKKNIVLTQHRFLKTTTENSDENERPFTFPIFANTTEAPVFMNEKSIIFQSKNLENIQLNMGNNAHFITAYSPEIREKLFSNFSNFSDSDRLKLLNESQMLAQSTEQYLRESDLVEPLLILKNEKNYNVWSSGLRIISNMAKIVESDESAMKNLKKLVHEITKDLFAELFDKKQNSKLTENEEKLFAVMLSRQIWSEDQKVVNFALDYFAKNKHSLKQIDGEIRSVIFANAVKNGTNEDFGFLLEQYKLTADAALKNEIASGLTTTENPKQTAKIIGILKDQSVIRPQDLFSWFAWMMMNKHSRTETWRWLRENWDYIQKTYSSDQSFDSFPRHAAEGLSNKTELEEFREFFREFRENPALKRTIAMGENDISSRMEWIAQNHESLAKALQKIIN